MMVCYLLLKDILVTSNTEITVMEEAGDVAVVMVITGHSVSYAVYLVT